MASSDNVLRGGMTPEARRRARAAVGARLHPRCGAVPEPERPAPGVEVFRPDVPDFLLTVVHGPATLPAQGGSIALCVDGAFEVTGDAESTRIARGDFRVHLDRNPARAGGIGPRVHCVARLSCRYTRGVLRSARSPRPDRRVRRPPRRSRPSVSRASAASTRMAPGISGRTSAGWRSWTAPASSPSGSRRASSMPRSGGGHRPQRSRCSSTGSVRCSLLAGGLGRRVPRPIRDDLFWFFVSAFAIVYLNSGFVAIGQYSLMYGLAALAAALLVRPGLYPARGGAPSWSRSSPSAPTEAAASLVAPARAARRGDGAAIGFAPLGIGPAVRGCSTCSCSARCWRSSR